MGVLFTLIFFPFIIIAKIFVALFWILKGMIFGVILFPLSVLGINTDSINK